MNRVGLAAFAAYAWAASASAAVITFDNVTPPVLPNVLFQDSYTSEGIVFRCGVGEPTGSTCFDGKLFFPPDVNPNGFTNIDPDGASILGSPLQAQVDGGGVFDLLGFTFGLRSFENAGDTPLTGEIRVRFRYDDGRDETETFEVHQFAPEAVSLTRLGLRRVTWLGGTFQAIPGTCAFCTHFGQSTGSIVIDDVVVDHVVSIPGEWPPVPPPIPEPGTWALFLTGFALAGAMVRRRRVASGPSCRVFH